MDFISLMYMTFLAPKQSGQERLSTIVSRLEDLQREIESAQGEVLTSIGLRNDLIDSLRHQIRELSEANKADNVLLERSNRLFGGLSALKETNSGDPGVA